MTVFWLRNVVVFLFSLSIVFGQQDPTQLLLLDLSSEEKIDSLLTISVTYADDYKLDSSLLFANAANQYAIESGVFGKQSKAEYSIGYAYDLNGDLISAIEHYEKSRAIYEELDNKYEVANSMNAKGVAAYFKGDFELALEYYLPTINYCEDHEVEEVLLNVLNNTGVIYRVTNKYDEAISIYHKTLALSKKGGNTDMVSTSYHNLGVAYNFADQPMNSLIYLDSAISMHSLDSNDFEIGRSTIAKGETYYLSLQDYKNARTNFANGLELVGANIDQEVLAKTYLLMAQLERDDQNYSKSKSLFEQGLSLINTTEREDLLANYYREMVELYDLQGNTTKAYEYLKKYGKVNSEIQSTEKLKAIEELQTQYETKQKVQEIDLLNIQNELQETQLTASRNILIFLSFGLLILGVLLYRLYSLNKKVKKSHDEKDTLLREIHHRVKNNLQVISALLTLQSSHLKNAKAKSALQEGQDRVQSMALIHKDLYQHDNLKGVNTKDYLEQLIENLIQSYSISDDEIDIRADIEEINLDVDTMIPLGLMINELISNALKHAFDQAGDNMLSISLHEKNGQLLLSVVDNGKGVNNIDLMKKQSFGYSLIQSFARKLDATLTFDEGVGLKVNLSINNYKKV